MNFYRFLTLIPFTMLLILSFSSLVYAGNDPHESAESWYTQGQKTADDARVAARNAYINSFARAKNIILFIGDGMGVSTVTAARILAGQQNNRPGEENSLFFETFPYLALAKTYNTNQQVSDSAGTMTAIMTGVKTKAGVISVDQSVTRNDCSTIDGSELTTALEHAEKIGMSTGIVSTARITHATPAATFAHTTERDFESDVDAAEMKIATGCRDIARQLVEFRKRYGNGLEVAMGGGRSGFIRHISGADPEGGGKGERLDGRDLTIEWLNKYPGSEYVWNRAQFDAIDPAVTDHLLGLFEMEHMQYELDREHDRGGEPSLTEMTEKAIDILKKNPEGFFLMVESGRIDHAHHVGNAKRALYETIELSKAVQKAHDMTDQSDTLIIVTADHSHVLTIAGYPTRGNPILGKVVDNDAAGRPHKHAKKAVDGKPYATLGYQNGPGFASLPNGGDVRKDLPLVTGRVDLSLIDTQSKGFHQEALVPLAAESHSGEDVAIYASGPGASMFQGTIEQNVIFHIMNKAAQLEQRSGLHYKKQ